MKYIDRVLLQSRSWWNGVVGKTTTQSTLIPLRWEDRFLDNYAGRLIEEPRIAIVELVANCWDAGATTVDIQWPSESGGFFKIADNGTGMSKSDFERIWATIDYNRVRHQGKKVVFPPDIPPTSRPAYGRNGKGRHSLFCFSSQYSVETWKDNIVSFFAVKRGTSQNPIEINSKGVQTRTGHGTSISCYIEKNHFAVENVKNLIGSKFITDPSFNLSINGNPVSLSDFKGETCIFPLPNGESIEILLIESLPGRTSMTQGIAWWVNGRLVSEPSWEGVEGILIDRRTQPSRIYTFIVKADVLIDEVKEDWTGFKDTEIVKAAKEKVADFVLSSINEQMQDVRRATKLMILEDKKAIIRELPNLSKERVGTFINDLQSRFPRMKATDLSYTLDVFATMELARTGYELLKKLATLSPDDISGLDDILAKWSVTDAKIVLDELERRLYVIEEMEKLTSNPSTKELSELQPLFERALWIFGPEYEGCQYFSNRTLLKSLEMEIPKGMKKFHISGLKRRPDFLILSEDSQPEATLGIYASDRYDGSGDISGIDKALLVELKAGMSKIDEVWRRQGEDYALIVRRSGRIDATSVIKCFVLGTSVDPAIGATDARPPELIEVVPKSYCDVLRIAHSRTFNLSEKIKEAKGIKVGDKEVNEVLAQKDLNQEYEQKAKVKP